MTNCLRTTKEIYSTNLHINVYLTATYTYEISSKLNEAKVYSKLASKDNPYKLS